MSLQVWYDKLNKRMMNEVDRGIGGSLQPKSTFFALAAMKLKWQGICDLGCGDGK